MTIGVLRSSGEIQADWDASLSGKKKKILICRISHDVNAAQCQENPSKNTVTRCNMHAERSQNTANTQTDTQTQIRTQTHTERPRCSGRLQRTQEVRGQTSRGAERRETGSVERNIETQDIKHSKVLYVWVCVYSSKMTCMKVLKGLHKASVMTLFCGWYDGVNVRLSCIFWKQQQEQETLKTHHHDNYNTG